MKNFKFMLVLLILATITTIAISLCIGRFGLSITEVLKALSGGEVAQNVHNVVMQVRLPRIIAAVLVGAALGISGTAYQGVFKNQLVSPDLLGVSAGACV
ncbi:iron chelate uptake ABC transporter family permease subunit, partial [uncultured Campylobacter sp.]